MNTLQEILLIGKLPPYLEQAARDRFPVHRLVDEPHPETFLQTQGHRFDAVLTSAAIGLTDSVLAQLPNVRVISSFGVGLDKLPLQQAQERGIAVGYTPDVLNDCVADLAFGLLIDTARRISEADRFVRAGQWEKRGGNSFGLARKVSASKLGIVGLGRIGQTIARRAQGFDMEVRYHSRREVPQTPWGYESSLHQLAQWCDFLVIATSGGAQSTHLINAPVLEQLGPQGYLINIARGSVVDEQALLQALQQGTIAGAGLDVFEHEPQVPTAFMDLPNVVLLPHIASATHQTRSAMAELAIANLSAFAENGALIASAQTSPRK